MRKPTVLLGATALIFIGTLSADALPTTGLAQQIAGSPSPIVEVQNRPTSGCFSRCVDRCRVRKNPCFRRCNRVCGSS
jgi:hypothetical protein